MSGRRRITILLWAILVQSTLTNLLLFSIAGYGAWLLLAPGSDGASKENPVVYGAPARSLAGDTEPDLGRLGVDPDQWARLLAGEALIEKGSGEGLVSVRARFLVRAGVDRLHEFLADPLVATAIYSNVDQAEVRRRGGSGEGRFDIVWYQGKTGPFTLEYVVRQTYRVPDWVRWKLEPGPGTSERLTQCEGGWYTTATGLAGVTLAEYRNQFRLEGLPAKILEALVDDNLPHAMTAIRGKME